MTSPIGFLVDSLGQPTKNTVLTPQQVAAGATSVVAVTPGGMVDGAGNTPAGGLTAAQAAALVAVSRLPSIPSPVAGIVSDAYTGGATPWTRLYGPNEFRLNWAGSAEWTTVPSYVTAASASGGPALFRREGASIMLNFANASQTYGNYRNSAAALAATTFKNKTIAIIVYVHRMQAAMSVRLRIGTDTANWIYYTFQSAANMLVEGWNTLLCHTSEAIGVNAAPNGQLSFQTGYTVLDAWYVGAGTFDPNINGATINYVAVEFLGYGGAVGDSRTFAWLEGIYTGGKDKPRFTIGFDIQGAGLDLAKSTMDKYGLIGYAAVPTGNGSPANPTYLWSAADVSRMQALYAAGWPIIQHSVSHTSLGTFSDDGMLTAEFEACREQLIAIGCPAGADLMATPNGSWSNRLVAVAAKAGIRWMRHVNNAPMLVSRGLVGTANPLIQGAMTLANLTDTVKFVAYLDLLELYGCSGHGYTHGITNGASDSLNTNVIVFDAMCAILAARRDASRIEVPAITSLVRDSAPPNIDSILAPPSRLALVPAASPFDLINTGYKPLRHQISGGTVSAITYSRDGSTFDSVGQTSGQFDVNPGDRLRITYTVAPTVIQYSI